VCNLLLIEVSPVFGDVCVHLGSMTLVERDHAPDQLGFQGGKFVEDLVWGESPLGKVNNRVETNPMAGQDDFAVGPSAQEVGKIHGHSLASIATDRTRNSRDNPAPVRLTLKSQGIDRIKAYSRRNQLADQEQGHHPGIAGIAGSPRRVEDFPMIDGPIKMPESPGLGIMLNPDVLLAPKFSGPPTGGSAGSHC
jgi:hypothetical protein